MSKGVCTVRVAKWDTYQHYKHRDPPWIKFHNSLLEDPGIAALPDVVKAHLFGLWLLASRLGNKIPADAAFVARRINASSKVDLNLLIDSGFLEWACGCLQHASKTLATCTTETEQSRDRVETETEGASAPEVVVFDHWREVAGHPDARFTAKRKRAVKERLREGYTVEQLRAAIEGCRASPFHQGANDRRVVYDDLELICRSGEKVEQFIGFTGNGTGLARADPPLSTLTEHNLRALGLEGEH